MLKDGILSFPGYSNRMASGFTQTPVEALLISRNGCSGVLTANLQRCGASALTGAHNQNYTFAHSVRKSCGTSHNSFGYTQFACNSWLHRLVLRSQSPHPSLIAPCALRSGTSADLRSLLAVLRLGGTLPLRQVLREPR